MSQSHTFNDLPANIVVKQLKDRTPGESWTSLYYGPTGSGKTWFCGTAGPRLLFLNTGQGIETLLSPAFKHKYPNMGDIITVDINEKITDQGIVEEALAWDLITDTLDYFLVKHRDKFDVVALDDATFSRRFALNKALELNTEARSNKSKRKPGTTDYQKPDVGDYGIEMGIIEWFLATYIQRFKSLGLHFIMTAHERHIYGKPAKIGDEAPLQKILPGFTGKTFPDQVPAYFDDVFRAEVVGGVGNTHYRCRTQGTESDRGKSRHGGVFPTVVSNPNFHKMLEQIRRAELHPSYRS